VYNVKVEIPYQKLFPSLKQLALTEISYEKCSSVECRRQREGVPSPHFIPYP